MNFWTAYKGVCCGIVREQTGLRIQAIKVFLDGICHVTTGT